MVDVSTQTEEKFNVLPIRSLSCQSCDVTWCLATVKLLDPGVELGVFCERLYCKLCLLAVLRNSIAEVDSDENAFDMLYWHKSLIQLQNFHCCVCGNFASTRHKLFNYPNGVVRVYSYKHYLGHQFCYYCFFHLIRKKSMRLLPKACCKK